MKQVITITPSGGVVGLLHKKGQGLDLLSLGTASVVRASEVTWSDTHQKWKVEFKAGAGCFDGKVLTSDLIGRVPPKDTLTMPTYTVEAGNVVFFDTYEDGVKAEITMLNAFRLAGEI